MIRAILERASITKCTQITGPPSLHVSLVLFKLSLGQKFPMKITRLLNHCYRLLDATFIFAAGHSRRVGKL